MNNIYISGFVASDVEHRVTQQGNSVATLIVAVKRPKAKEPITDFFKVVCWRKTADFVAEHFGKGKGIEVSGILTNRKWQDKDGNDRITTEIIADSIEFSKRKRDESNQSPSENEQSAPQADFEEIKPDDEDLPF